MFRSRVFIDRRILRVRPPRDASPSEVNRASMEQNFKTKKQVLDASDNITNFNNFRTATSNNFDFIEPFHVGGDENDSLESLKIKNWRYHLTNNKF